jgi:hypothetical protein
VLGVGAATALLVFATFGTARRAWAHGDGETTKAGELVRQAIALIVNTPRDTMAIEDKITDALDSPDTEGVNLDLVKQAKDAFDAGDLHQVRALLEVSIGAQPHLSDTDVRPIGETASPATGADTAAAVRLVTGEETGTNVVVDPLEARRSFDAGTWLVLTTAIAVALAGVALAVRFRPPVSLRSMRSTPAGEA